MRKIQIPPSPASSRRGIRGRPGAFVQTGWLVGKTASHPVYFPSHPVRASSHLFFIIPGKAHFPAALRIRAYAQLQQARTDRQPTPLPHLPRKKGEHRFNSGRERP